MNLLTVLRLLSTLRLLRTRERWTRTQLESYQRQQSAQLRAFAYEHASFYRQFHQGLFDRPLSELPILTKQVLMAHFDELVTDPTIHLADIRTQRDEAPDIRYLGKYWVNATSGSTGSPGIFLFDDQEWATVLASFTRGYEWAGVRHQSDAPPQDCHRFLGHTLAYVLSGRSNAPQPVGHHLASGGDRTD